MFPVHVIDWCGSHHSNQRVKLRIFGNHKWKNKILEIVVFGNYCFLKGIWKHFAFKKVMWNRSPAEYAVLHWYMNMPCLLIYFYNPFFYFIDLKTWIKLLTLALNMKNIFNFIYLFIFFKSINNCIECLVKINIKTHLWCDIKKKKKHFLITPTCFETVRMWLFKNK